jgi:hypothetical protein
MSARRTNISPASRVTLQWAEDFRRHWALFGLVTSLRKVRAQSGPRLDQSKTPFSQRKPVFSIKFLLVGVPYHSEYLDGVTDTVEEDLEDEESKFYFGFVSVVLDAGYHIELAGMSICYLLNPLLPPTSYLNAYSTLESLDI